MIVLGLTGSIGMGKTAVAAHFATLGVPVFAADEEVHRLLAPKGTAVGAVLAAFPTVGYAGGVDRQALGARVFGDAAALGRLESILHPLVRERERAFVRDAAHRGSWLVVLDIPLLFETRAVRRCDFVAVASAPVGQQRERVLARPGMTEDRFAAITAAQMSDLEKRRRADFVVPTGTSRVRALQNVRRIVRTLRNRGRKRPPRVARLRRLAMRRRHA
ncbi:MAG: dephospho-CoA kinase [Alphaproteobacteria bacterium]|nr:dephospho-CoA kinase [Alphaproteobacteria bacterium]